jgi:hypothetical protein
MISERMARSLEIAFIYLSVSVFAAAFLLLDTGLQHPPSATDWALLLLLEIPILSTGEWLSGGILRNALLTVRDLASQPFRMQWWHIFYYSMMCILFAVTAVSIFEWMQRVWLLEAQGSQMLVSIGHRRWHLL